MSTSPDKPRSLRILTEYWAVILGGIALISAVSTAQFQLAGSKVLLEAHQVRLEAAERRILKMEIYWDVAMGRTPIGR